MTRYEDLTNKIELLTGAALATNGLMRHVWATKAEQLRTRRDMMRKVEAVSEVYDATMLMVCIREIESVKVAV